MHFKGYRDRVVKPPPPPSANDTFYPKIIAIPKLSKKNTSSFLRDVYFNEKSSPLFEFFFTELEKVCMEQGINFRGFFPLTEVSKFVNGNLLNF